MTLEESSRRSPSPEQSHRPGLQAGSHHVQRTLHQRRLVITNPVLWGGNKGRTPHDPACAPQWYNHLVMV